jgi:hypothetical protein
MQDKPKTVDITEAMRITSKFILTAAQMIDFELLLEQVPALINVLTNDEWFDSDEEKSEEEEFLEEQLLKSGFCQVNINRKSHLELTDKGNRVVNQIVAAAIELSQNIEALNLNVVITRKPMPKSKPNAEIQKAVEEANKEAQEINMGDPIDPRSDLEKQLDDFQNNDKEPTRH